MGKISLKAKNFGEISPKAKKFFLGGGRRGGGGQKRTFSENGKSIFRKMDIFRKKILPAAGEEKNPGFIVQARAFSEWKTCSKVVKTQNFSVPATGKHHN